MRFRPLTKLLPARRTGLAVVPLAVLALPLLVSPAPRASAQGRKVAEPEIDLDKLYKVETVSFQRIASRLNSLARPRADLTSAWARFELFEPVSVRLPPDYYGGPSNGFKVYLKQHGKAFVIGNGRMWAPREGDSQENFKDLTVSLRRGHPRTLTYRFRVHATVENGTGPNPPVTILGRELFEFQLIEHPGDKSLRLVLDPATFRQHQASVSSNWVVEEETGSPEENKGVGKKKETKKKDEEEKQDKGNKQEPPADEAARSEITLVRSFKADERAIVIGFRRKWSGAGDRVVDGALHVEMNPSLVTNLYYELPAKDSKKTRRVRAAYFIGGHKAQ
jgi:hypothetical protein